MKRLLLAAVAAAFVVVPVTGAAADFGGQCDGLVDTMCRQHVCQPDELDCGMIPPCLLWVRGVCAL